MGTGLVTSDYGGEGTLALVKDAWVPFRAEIDLAASTYSEYYNDQLLGSGTWSRDGGPVQVQALDLFANGSDAVYYDNINLVPESSSIALAAAGALGLCLRRRRARA